MVGFPDDVSVQACSLSWPPSEPDPRVVVLVKCVTESHTTYLTSFSFLFFSSLIFFWSYFIVFVPFFVFLTSIHSVALMTSVSKELGLVSLQFHRKT